MRTLKVLSMKHVVANVIENLCFLSNSSHAKDIAEIDPDINFSSMSERTRNCEIPLQDWKGYNDTTWWAATKKSTKGRSKRRNVSVDVRFWAINVVFFKLKLHCVAIVKESKHPSEKSQKTYQNASCCTWTLVRIRIHCTCARNWLANRCGRAIRVIWICPCVPLRLCVHACSCLTVNKEFTGSLGYTQTETNIVTNFCSRLQTNCRHDFKKIGPGPSINRKAKSRPLLLNRTEETHSWERKIG